MSNYYSKTRTNYFRVTDPNKLAELISNLSADGKIELWEKQKDNTTLYGFGGDGSIAGLAVIPNEDGKCEDYCDESDMNAFLRGLQSLLPDDEAIIILEVGSARMQYLIGTACIITQKDVNWMDLSFMAIDKAAEMLGVENWSTQLEY